MVTKGLPSSTMLLDLVESVVDGEWPVTQEAIDAFLRQDLEQAVDAEQSWAHLQALVDGLGVS